MTKNDILTAIRRHCRHCPLKCDEECGLHLLKDGIDPTPAPRREPTQKQLDALMLSSKRTDEKAIEYRKRRETDI